VQHEERVQTGISSFSRARFRRVSDRQSGFSLVEVVLSMVLVSTLCISIFVSINLISKLAMDSAIRTEAYRLAQAEAERLESVGFGSVAAYPNETIISSLKTSTGRSTDAQFAYSATNASGRVEFVRRVVDLGSTSSMKNLQVEVEWTWMGKKPRSPISLVVLRHQ
jgi:Tfp pilus assembly protein PilV